jgi:hypothetical protein
MKNKFWEDESIELMKEYNYDGQKAETMAKLMIQNPHIYKYLKTSFDGMIGMHQVYLVKFKNKTTVNLIKIGYTKHKDIQQRFGESRWGEKLEIDEVIKQVELQAKGAVEFEKYIKKAVPPNAELDGSNPGKGEFYNMSELEEIKKVWDNNVDKYKDVWGIKPPN